MSRSSHQKIHRLGNTSVGLYFLTMLQAEGLHSKETQTQVFSHKFSKIFKSNYFNRTHVCREIDLVKLPNPNLTFEMGENSPGGDFLDTQANISLVYANFSVSFT